jgi:hypothetical protein
MKTIIVMPVGEVTLVIIHPVPLLLLRNHIIIVIIKVIIKHQPLEQEKENKKKNMMKKKKMKNIKKLNQMVGLQIRIGDRRKGREGKRNETKTSHFQHATCSSQHQ